MKIRYQLISGISITSVFAIFFTISFLVFISFLLSNSSYRNFINIVHNLEFEELSNLGNAITNRLKSLEENVLTLGALFNIVFLNFYYDSKYLSETYRIPYTDNMFIHKDDLKAYNSTNSKTDLSNLLIYYSTKYSKSELEKNNEFIRIKSVLLHMYPFISCYQNMALSEHSLTSWDIEYFKGFKIKIPQIDKIIVTHNELELIVVTPNLEDLNSSIDIRKVKEQVTDKMDYMYQQARILNNINRTSNLFKNDYDLIRRLNLFEDNTNGYGLLQNNDSSSERYFYASNLLKLESGLDIRLANYKEFSIGSIYFFTQKDVTGQFFDDLVINGIGNSYFLTNSTYNLLQRNQCKKFRYIGADYSNFDFINKMSINGMQDCFQNVSHYQPLQKNYRDIDIIMNETNVNTPIFSKNFTYFNFSSTHSVTKRMLINDVYYKVKKLVIPYSTSLLFNYFYPETKIYYLYLLKNEGRFENFTTFLYNHIVKQFLISFMFSIIILLLILLIIFFFILKTMNVINYPLENTIQTLSDTKDFYKAKKQLEEDHLEKEEKSMIDEINDLISIIVDLIEGNIINSANRMENSKSEGGNQKYEPEFLSNLIVFEESILEMLEKENFLYGILEEDIDIIKQKLKGVDGQELKKILKNNENHAVAKKTTKSNFKTSYEKVFISYPFKEVKVQHHTNNENLFECPENEESKKQIKLEIVDPFIEDLLLDKTNPLFYLSLSLEE